MSLEKTTPSTMVEVERGGLRCMMNYQALNRKISQRRIRPIVLSLFEMIYG
jgi:hypothetical protein